MIVHVDVRSLIKLRLQETFNTVTCHFLSPAITFVETQYLTVVFLLTTENDRYDL
jgi:hypothetical protein